MRKNHLIVFTIFILALLFREFLFDPIFDQLRESSSTYNEFDYRALDSMIRFLQITFLVVYLFSLFYLIKFLRGNILIKLIPLILLTHLLVNNPNLYFVYSEFSLANPYIFSIISAGIMIGLVVYSEREYLYNSIKTSVNPFFDTMMDVLGFLALISVPFFVESSNYGYIPYVFYNEYPEAYNLFILSFLPIGLFMLLGVFVVIFDGHFKSYYLYRLIILTALSFLYVISSVVGIYDIEVLYDLHKLGLWLLTIIYALYFSQVSISPFADK